LFILAGYTSVGKTTLSIHALEKRIPLFGKKYDHLFQSFKIPSRLPEGLLSVEEKLACGCWFSWNEIHVLGELAQSTQNMFLHLDLCSMISPALHLHHVTPEMTSLLPRSSISATSDSHNELFIRSALRIDGFSGFDNIIVNTLYAPWGTIARQRLTRISGMNRRDKRGRDHLLFRQEDLGKKVHRSIYSAWLHSVHVLNPELSLLSEVKNGKLLIKRLKTVSGN